MVDLTKLTRSPWLSGTRFHAAQLVAVAILLLVTLSGALDQTLDDAHGLAQPARAYLLTEREHAEEFLLVAGAVNEVLAMVASSQAGVSFVVEAQVRIGELIGSLHRASDWALVAAAWSVLGLLGLELTLGLAGALAKPLLVLTLVVAASHLIVRVLLPRYRASTLMALRMVASLFLVAHLVVPLALYCAGHLSNALTGDLRVGVRAHYQMLHQGIAERPESRGLKNDVKDAVSLLTSHSPQKGKQAGGNAGLQAVRYLVASVFDLLVLPLGFLAVFAWALRSVMSHLRSVHEDWLEREASLERRMANAEARLEGPAAGQ